MHNVTWVVNRISSRNRFTDFEFMVFPVVFWGATLYNKDTAYNKDIPFHFPMWFETSSGIAFRSTQYNSK